LRKINLPEPLATHSVVNEAYRWHRVSTCATQNTDATTIDELS
jgi:hypothetical protein